uniref:Ataxin 10 n=1 Tax=Gadus morhua TaxID=8049 RepID=A0A8C5AZF4_GADMO
MGPFLRLIITNQTFLSLFTHCSTSSLTLCSLIREEVEKDVFCSLWSLLSRLREELEASGEGEEEGDELNLQLMAECFRAQRNACVQSPRNQALLSDLSFIDESLKVISLLQRLYLQCGDRSAVALDPLRCGLQFLGNMAVGNQLCKDSLWTLSLPHLMLDLLSGKDEKVVSYASMVLHTCLDEEKVEELAKPDNIPLALRVMELCRTHPDLDWTVLIATQHFLKSSALVVSMYSGISHLERMTLLELLAAQLGEGGGGDSGIPGGVAAHLASSFQTGCRAVLALASGSADGDEEALTVISLLDVLCEMTSDLEQFMFLQDHAGLLQATVGTPQETRHLINFRSTRDNEFLKSKMIARKQWELFLEEMGMEGKVTRQQASKKWENLKKKYKDLRTPKTGSGTESGEVTVATWQYYDLMHEVLGARPAIDPSVLVSSIQEDPMVILMEIVEPCNQAPPTAASTPVHPPTTSIMRRRSKTVAELLAEEALQEQRRHEESEAKTDRFLDLFERMVNKL